MDNLRGITLMIAAMAAFALEDAFLKAASGSVPVGQILFMLGIGGGLVFAALARRRGLPLIAPELRHPAVMLRNLAEMISAVLFISALAIAPISLVITILQAAPLAVTLGAALFLGAPVGWRRWCAIAVGFAGVVLIVRPGAEAFEPGALLAILTVFLMAARDLATRQAPATISSLVLACWGFVAIIPAGVVLMLFVTGPVMPDGRGWLFLAGALVFGASGYYAVTAAMRVGEIAVVTPFRYTRLLFSMTLGILVFAERPDGPTLAGAALIIGSGLYTLIREARLYRAQRPLSSPASGG